MDFSGQKLAETFCLYVLLAFSVVAFVAGWTSGEFRNTIFIYGAGVAVALILTVPNWPWFNWHPLKWQPVQQSGESALAQQIPAVKKKQKRVKCFAVQRL